MSYQIGRQQLLAHSTSGSQLWLAAILTFGVGDFVTTGAGLSVPGIKEAGPVAGLLLQQYGIAAILWLKVLCFALAYAMWVVVPRPHRLGIPLGLIFVGTLVTGWNTAVVLTVVA